MGLTPAEQKQYNERVPKGYVHLVHVKVNEETGEERVINQYVQPVNVDVHIEKYDFQFYSEEDKVKLLDGLVDDARGRGVMLTRAQLTPKWYAKAPVYQKTAKK